MLPVYAPGDHILTFNWGRISSGDIIAFNTGRIFFIKRVDRIEEDVIHVSGDNKARSLKVGPINKNQILGKVIFKY